MQKPYKIVSGASTPDTPDRRELADWLAKRKFQRSFSLNS